MEKIDLASEILKLQAELKHIVVNVDMIYLIRFKELEKKGIVLLDFGASKLDVKYFKAFVKKLKLTSNDVFYNGKDIWINIGI